MKDRLTGLVAAVALLTACGQASETAPASQDIETGATFATPDGDTPRTDPAADAEATGPDAETAPCPQGAGCFGDPCDEPEDCWSGFCATHLGDGACTKTCETECPAGWSCEQVLMGGDPVFLCVSDAASLCRPCNTASDCAVDGVEDACVTHGADGAFCGASCSDEQACPEGFTCTLSETTGGGTSLQCVPTEGECDCSQAAVNLGLATTCSVTNALGTCSGIRACTAEGLADCDALVPAIDGCDHIDNDCDGETDESCAYLISGFLLGDGAAKGTSEGVTVSGALGAPRVIGTSTNALWTIRSGLVGTGGQ